MNRSFKSLAALFSSELNSTFGISLREVTVKTSRSISQRVVSPKIVAQGILRTIKPCHIRYAESIWDNLAPSVNLEMLAEYSRSAQHPSTRSKIQRV